MAAGFLITRILVAFLLSELDYSTAFPGASSYVYPDAWQGIRKKPEGYGNWNRRPLQYIRALRQTYRKLQPKVHDQVQGQPWPKPQGRSLKVYGPAPIQNQPSLYHQSESPDQPWSDVATKSTQEMSPSQPPLQNNHPPPKPRHFEFNIKVPFTDVLGQHEETSSTIKGSNVNSGGSDGSGHYSQLYRPSSVQISSTFNSASGSDGFSNNGFTGKTVHAVSKPSFQLSLSVPIPSTIPSSKPSSSSSGGYLADLQRPGSDGFVQNSYMEPAKPQSSSVQSRSEWAFLNPAHNVQQQTEHHVYDPVQTKYTDRTQISLSPGDASQYRTPTAQMSQHKSPPKQSLVFPKPSAPSLPIPQYPLQSDHFPSGYYSAQINPLSNDYGKGQKVSSDPTNVHLPLPPSQYERIPSGHHSTGPVKPSVNNYGQYQTWQPDVTQVTFDSEQHNYGQFKPSFEQNIDTVRHVSPVQPSLVTVAPSQYELPSFHQVVTTNYAGTGNWMQMVPTDSSSSSPYQYSRDQSGQDALPGHHPSPNFQGLSADFQPQMRLPEHYTSGGQLDGKPKYTKVFIDVDDEMDRGNGQHNYFAAPQMPYDGYSGTWTEQNMAYNSN